MAKKNLRLLLDTCFNNGSAVCNHQLVSYTEMKPPTWGLFGGVTFKKEDYFSGKGRLKIVCSISNNSGCFFCNNAGRSKKYSPATAKNSPGLVAP